MLTDSHDIYEILGIDRNADMKTIKKVYAKLVKQYHPEEYPEEWERIHNAYECAMRIAIDRGQNISSEHQESELDDIFKDVEKIANEQWEEKERAEKQKLMLALRAVRHMTEKKKLRIEEWRAFFSLKNILPVVSQREFLHELGDCLTSKKMNDELYLYFNEQMDIICDYLEQNGVNMRAQERYISDFEYVKAQIRAAHEYYYYTIEDWISDNGFVLLRILADIIFVGYVIWKIIH